MNNLLSYCGLIDAKIRASDKDLPVSGSISIYFCCFPAVCTLGVVLLDSTYNLDTNIVCTYYLNDLI